MPAIASDTALAWAPFACVMAHICEEFVFPGGFSEWYRRYRPDAAVSFTPRYAVGINALLVALCLVIPLQGIRREGAALWLTIAAVLFANVLFHLRAVLRTREYSPGVVTATLLYVPLAVYGYWVFVRSGRASVGTAICAAVLGGSYNFVSAWMHHRRARRARARADG